MLNTNVTFKYECSLFLQQTDYKRHINLFKVEWGFQDLILRKVYFMPKIMPKL